MEYNSTAIIFPSHTPSNSSRLDRIVPSSKPTKVLIPHSPSAKYNQIINKTELHNHPPPTLIILNPKKPTLATLPYTTPKSLHKCSSKITKPPQSVPQHHITESNMLFVCYTVHALPIVNPTSKSQLSVPPYFTTLESHNKIVHRQFPNYRAERSPGIYFSHGKLSTHLSRNT